MYLLDLAGVVAPRLINFKDGLFFEKVHSNLLISVRDSLGNAAVRSRGTTITTLEMTSLIPGSSMACRGPPCVMFNLITS